MTKHAKFQKYVNKLRRSDLRNIILTINVLGWRNFNFCKHISYFSGIVSACSQILKPTSNLHTTLKYHCAIDIVVDTHLWWYANKQH